MGPPTDRVVRIRRVESGDVAAVHAAADCFDGPPRPDVTARFLASPGHHLLLAYLGEDPVGMITGVEMIHPDKGTEMFVYELGVRDGFRRQGIARALVAALTELAIERGCDGMWVLTEDDNVAALGTYRASGARTGGRPVLLDWTFHER